MSYTFKQNNTTRNIDNHTVSTFFEANEQLQLMVTIQNVPFDVDPHSEDEDLKHKINVAIRKVLEDVVNQLPAS
jgi:hypothetical protein